MPPTVGAGLAALATFALLALTLREEGSLSYPLAYPQALLAGMGFLFAVLAWPSRRAPATPVEPASRQRHPAVVAAVLVLCLLYILSWDVVGYFSSTFLFVILMLLLAGERSIVSFVLLSAGLTGLLYLVFYRLLLMPLPRATWFAGG